MPNGPSRNVPACAVEQRAEHARRVEARHAQPVDRAVGRDERAGVAVRQERVVGDRRERRRRRRALRLRLGDRLGAVRGGRRGRVLIGAPPGAWAAFGARRTVRTGRTRRPPAPRPGRGVSRAAMTYATTTATITSGIAASPSEASSSVASSVEVSGSASITVDIAPMPIATAGTSSSPGRCDAAMPPAAPMNIAGNTGPPRNALSDSA